MPPAETAAVLAVPRMRVEERRRSPDCAFGAVGQIERWIAERRWEAAPGGRRARERLGGWHCRVEPLAGGPT